MVKIFWPFGQMMAYTQVIGAVYDTTGMNQTGSGPFLKYQLKSLARLSAAAMADSSFATRLAAQLCPNGDAPWPHTGSKDGDGGYSG